MVERQITVSQDSLESAAAYIRAALKRDPAQNPMSMAGDLHRALQCLAEAPLTEEEIREKN
jgi:hypothetical protein